MKLTLTPQKSAETYGWKNDPEKVADQGHARFDYSGVSHAPVQSASEGG